MASNFRLICNPPPQHDRVQTESTHSEEMLLFPRQNWFYVERMEIEEKYYLIHSTSELRLDLGCFKISN